MANSHDIAAAEDERNIRYAELVPEFLCLCRAERIVHVNAAGVQMLGAAAVSDLVGRRLSELLHADYAPVLDDGLAVLRSEETLPLIFLRADGTSVEAEARVREWPSETGDGEPLWGVYARNLSAHLGAVKEVMASQDRYRSLFDLARDFICTTVDGKITMINAAALRILGYDRAVEVVGRRLAELVHPDYMPVVELGLPTLADEEGQLPLKLVTRNGMSVDVEVRVIALGRNNSFMIEAHDIRRRLRSAEALREREARLHGILDAVADGIFTVDEHGIIQSFNRSAEKIFGFRAEEINGRALSLILPGRTADEYVSDFKSWLAGSNAAAPMEMEGMRSDGSRLLVEMNLSDLWLGRSRLFTGVLRDITDRKKAEEIQRRYKEELEEVVEERTRDLRRLSHRTRQILDSAGDAIVGLDEGGIIMFANPAAGRMLGWPQEDLKGEAARNILRYADGARKGRGIPVAAALRRGIFFERTEAMILRRDGSAFAAEYASSPIEDAGQVVGAVVVFRDVTERKAADERLRVSATVFDTAAEGILVCRPDGVITMSNPAISSIMAEDLSYIQRMTVNDLLFPPGDTGWRDMMAALDVDHHWDREFWTQTRRGDPIAVHLRAAAVRNDDGTIGSVALTVSDITQRKKDEERIRFQASYDMLTGLPNRVLFHDRLEHAIAVAKRSNSGVALLFIDLDGFKAINDTFGHEAGDLILEESAKRLVDSVRASDTVARLGGDEFTVILEDVLDHTTVRVLAERILKSLSAPFPLGSALGARNEAHVGHISGSIGIAMFPSHADSAAALLRFSDHAMYDAKEAGKTCFRFYEPERVAS